jgi:hypothetical protein
MGSGRQRVVGNNSACPLPGQIPPIEDVEDPRVCTTSGLPSEHDRAERSAAAVRVLASPRCGGCRLGTRGGAAGVADRRSRRGRRPASGAGYGERVGAESDDVGRSAGHVRPRLGTAVEPGPERSTRLSHRESPHRKPVLGRREADRARPDDDNHAAASRPTRAVRGRGGEGGSDAGCAVIPGRCPPAAAPADHERGPSAMHARREPQPPRNPRTRPGRHPPVVEQRLLRPP